MLIEVDAGSGASTVPCLRIVSHTSVAPALRLRGATAQVAPLVTIEDGTGSIQGGLDSRGIPFGCLQTVVVEQLTGVPLEDLVQDFHEATEVYDFGFPTGPGTPAAEYLAVFLAWLQQHLRTTNSSAI